MHALAILALLLLIVGCGALIVAATVEMIQRYVSKQMMKNTFNIQVRDELSRLDDKLHRVGQIAVLIYGGTVLTIIVIAMLAPTP